MRSIKRDGWLCRYAYSICTRSNGTLTIFNPDFLPEKGAQIDLCSLFWRTVGVSLMWLLWAFMAVIGVIGIAIIVAAFIESLIHSRGFRFGTLGFLVTGILFFFAYRKRVTQSEPAQALAAYVKAKKSKFCPILEIE